MSAFVTNTAEASRVMRSLQALADISCHRNLRLEPEANHLHRHGASAGQTKPRIPEYLNIYGTRPDAADRSLHNDALIVLTKLEC